MGYKKFSLLDASNDLDVLYTYVNISHYIAEVGIEEVVKKVKEVKMKDKAMGMYALTALEKVVFEILSEETKDTEIEEEYRKSMEKYSKIKETAKEQVEGTKDEEKDTKKSNKKIRDHAIIQNISHLLGPFVYTNDKICVDFVAFFYRKIDVDAFELLFESYKDKEDLLVELHLLKARLVQDKIGERGVYDMTKMKKMLKEKKQEEKSSEKIENSKILVFNSNIVEAKKLLMGITKKDQKFFIENAALFLSLKYDSDIFYALMKCANNTYFYPSTAKLTLPWYFYKYLYINSLIYFDLPYNPWTLKYYLEYFIGLGDNSLPNEMGYLMVEKWLHKNCSGSIGDIMKLVGVNANYYKLAFMHIFTSLVKHSDNQTTGEKFGCLLESIEYYLEVFDMEEVEEVEEVELKDDLKEEVKNEFKLSLNGIKYSKHEENTKEMLSKYIGNEDGLKKLEVDYKNELKYDENIVRFILHQFIELVLNETKTTKNKLNCIIQRYKETLNQFLVDLSKNKKYKMTFMTKIVEDGILQNVGEDTRSKIGKVMLKVNRGEWRYCKYVKENRERIDKVFCVELKTNETSLEEMSKNC
ncbi:hypothetical protein ECANGB1_1871 [Enterospora canceri]|uniref:Uncharacterized protein n=1 Tax=Enterospora canceri TaxID=1081671 RepID=A0A1Y1S5F4_9MICR|nr:hypothetical protein ECANGB1_1871 [Enterospora canceri]